MNSKELKLDYFQIYNVTNHWINRSFLLAVPSIKLEWNVI